MNRLGVFPLTMIAAPALAGCTDRTAQPDSQRQQYRTQATALPYADAFNKAEYGMHGAMPDQYVGDPDGEFVRG